MQVSDEDSAQIAELETSLTNATPDTVTGVHEIEAILNDDRG